MQKIDTKNQMEIFSAGLEPAKEINPKAIQTLQNIGIYISQKKPKSVKEFLGRHVWSYVIVVCEDTNKACPRLFPDLLNGEMLYWPIEDPAQVIGDEKIAERAFEETRDVLSTKIVEFYNKKILGDIYE